MTVAKPLVKSLIYRSWFDCKEIQIDVTGEFARLYKAWGGKCFSVWCRNAAILFHFTRTGKVDYAYCEHGKHEIERIRRGLQYGGSWFEFFNGEMKELK